MSEHGFVLLWREMRDKQLFMDRPFCSFGAWVDMIMMTNYEDKSWNGETIERGSFVCSQPKLAARWGWSRSRVQRFLDALEREQRIEQLANSRRTKIRVTNFQQYQEFPKISNKRANKEPNKEPNNDPGTTKHILTHKHINTGKERAPHVLLSDEDLNYLIKKHGKALTEKAIQFFSEYQAEDPTRIKKNKNRNHKLCISRWVIDAVREREARQAKINGQPLPAISQPSNRPEHRIVRANPPSSNQAQKIINQVAQLVAVK